MTPRDAARRVIALEASALSAMAEMIGPEFDAVVEAIEAAAGKVVCAGVGKSGHVARKMAATLASTGTPAQYIHPTEASHGDMGMIGRDDVVIILSKSGEAPELSDMIAYARRFDIPLVALTAKPGSTLGQAATLRLMIPDAEEACAETRAPTTSTTLQMAMGDALAVALLERRGFTASDFRIYHPGGKLGAMLKTVGDLMHRGDAVPLVGPDTPMAEALLEMTAKRFGATGVIDENGRLIGVITDGDVRRRAGADFAAVTAGAVMTAAPMTIAPTALAAEALARLNETKRSVIFAVEDARPVGIAHLHDFLRAGLA